MSGFVCPIQWLMVIVIAAWLIRLGDTQPPDDSREPDEVEQDACEMTDIEEQQDTQAQASSNGTEASGYAAQTSLDDKHNEEDKEFVEKLMHGWGGHGFFLSPTELKEEREKYHKWRKPQADNDYRGSQLEECLDLVPDGDYGFCETHNELQPQCGDKKDIYNTEWFVICPKMKHGKRYVQYADVGTCVSPGDPCNDGRGRCRQEMKVVSLWSRPLKKPFKILPRLFPVDGYCSCKSN